MDSACRGDATLRERLEILLAAHEMPDALPEPPPETIRSGAGLETIDELLGRSIGRYKILEKIGEGGCGVVYAAEQIEPVRRQVALKLIKPGMSSKAVIARFEAERQALALMDHPNIAKVLDGGTTEAGLPYFVMELVRGMKITEHCDQQKLNTEERLKLFMQICQAVQHAHQKGIIHRDLKPSNVFVTMHDGVAVPKVIDFGIAKAIGSEQLTDKTVFTALDQFIGTPAYMSPEQAERREQAIDVRTDVYSLGVLLYEFLTGRPPFDTKALFESGFEHMLKIIREQEPPRPSTCLSTLDLAVLTSVAHVRGSEPPRLLHLIRGDLDWISVKCLEKDRARRYDSAEALAEDLRRHLGHKPIVARPPGAIYRLQKAIRRHRVVCLVGGAIVLGLLGGGLLSYWSGSGARLAKQSALVVTSTADSGPGSLREAVKRAAAGEHIAFAPALSGKTIVLTSGQISLDKSLTLDASELPRGIQISGNKTSRIFSVPHTTDRVMLNCLTLRDGEANAENGGAIQNSSSYLTLNRCTLFNNHTRANGGAIFDNGYLSMNLCTVASNSAANGGAIYIINGGILQLDQCTIAGNVAREQGGGIYNFERRRVRWHHAQTLLQEHRDQRCGRLHLGGPDEPDHQRQPGLAAHRRRRLGQ